MRTITLTEAEVAWLQFNALGSIKAKLDAAPAFCRTCWDEGERKNADPDDYRHDTVENCSAVLIREGRAEGCADPGIHHPYNP